MKVITAFDMFLLAPHYSNNFSKPSEDMFRGLDKDFKYYYSFLALNIMSDNLESLIIEKHPFKNKEYLKNWSEEYYRNCMNIIHQQKFIDMLKD